LFSVLMVEFLQLSLAEAEITSKTEAITALEEQLAALRTDLQEKLTLVEARGAELEELQKASESSKETQTEIQTKLLALQEQSGTLSADSEEKVQKSLAEVRFEVIGSSYHI
jgi:chromosome segregation ATPase